MLHYFLLIFWWTSAFASPHADTQQAEYIRLQSEMRTFADRQIWNGVERAFQKCEALDVPLAQRDFIVAAHAATARGDIAAARRRLWSAHLLGENQDVINWLWAIDAEYVNVELTASVGANLEYVGQQFIPDLLKILAHANQELESKGTFFGLLPAGAYRIQTRTFDVDHELEPIRVQVGEQYPKRRRLSRR